MALPVTLYGVTANRGAIKVFQEEEIWGPDLVDPLHRQRVAEPTTIFESQHSYNDSPVLWDTVLVGAGASTHLPNEAAVELSVGTASGDRGIRSTRVGKGYRSVFTGVLGPPVAGRVTRMGPFDANDGFFLEQTGSGPQIVRRSSVSGSVVETRVPQADWNGDQLMGTGQGGGWS